MPSVPGLPYQPVRLGIQEYLRPVFRIGNRLGNLSVLGHHMDALHVPHLGGDLIGMADVVQRLHPVRIHEPFRHKPLVNDPQVFVDMPALHLVPRKGFDLIPVMGIDLASLIHIGNQVGIQKGQFVVIEGIAVHKVQIDRPRKRLFKLRLLHRSHIKFI